MPPGEFRNIPKAVCNLSGERTREQRLVEQQLSQDAACGPRVNGLRVHISAQQQLGRSVPQRHHAWGVRLAQVIVRESNNLD